MAQKLITFTDSQWYFTVQELLDFMAQQDMSVCFTLNSCCSAFRVKPYKEREALLGRREAKTSKGLTLNSFKLNPQPNMWDEYNNSIKSWGDTRDKESRKNPWAKQQWRFIKQAKTQQIPLP